MSLAVHLEDVTAGRLSAPVALVRALLETPDVAALGGALARDGSEAAARMRELLLRHAAACERIAALARSGVAPRLGPTVDPVVATREFFDRLAEEHGDEAVALYSLGDAALLRRATDEVVKLLGDWGLLGPTRDVLDVGCGNGRLVEALHARVRSVLGLDVSERMLAAARSRCAGLANARFLEGTGRDLAGVPDASVDLALCVDAFPYVVAAGEALARAQTAEAARVLRPGGTWAVLNLSYRGDVARDAHDFRAWCEAAGLAVVTCGETPFALWDGRAYRAVRPPAGGA